MTPAADSEAVTSGADTRPSCPFYGRYLATTLVKPFLLIDQHGNQCAIVTGPYSCAMEIARLPVDWRDCKLLKETVRPDRGLPFTHLRTG